MNTERFEEAEKYYKKEIQINPTYDNVYFNLGLLYFKENKTNEAIQFWKKTIEINPKFVYVYENLAKYYSNTDNVIELEKIKQQARKYDIHL
ncbi:MAG: tetratricopeptide repeat protein [Bacteroidales bacterium]|nr:tetratricopeptide repeat protein [Bacteroidales bacterium]